MGAVREGRKDETSCFTGTIGNESESSCICTYGGFVMNGERFSKTWNSCWLTLALCLSFLLGVAPAGAEDADKPTASVSIDFMSQYIWRGFALSADSLVIQPSVTVGYKGFALNVWGNLDTDQNNPDPKFLRGVKWNETDLTLSYTRELYPNLTGTVGMIYYSLANPPGNADDSFEVYGGLSYALPWFTIGVTGYREAYNFPGWWMQIDLSRNFKLPWYDMSADVGASFGYLDSDPSNFAKWHAGMLNAALNIPIGKYIVISPKIGYSFPLHDEDQTPILRTGSWDGEDSHVFGGIRITASF